MRTEFSKTQRRLNPSQHRDDVDVFNAAAAEADRQLIRDAAAGLPVSPGFTAAGLTSPPGRSQTRPS